MHLPFGGAFFLCLMKIIVQIIIHFLVAGIFIFSGIAKLFTYNDFIYFIYGELNQPLEWVDLFGFLLLALEVIIGVQFLLLSRRKVLVVGTILFISLLSLFVIIHPTENCHCFGTLFEFNTKETLLKNAGILVLLFLLLFGFKKSFQYKWKKQILYSLSVLTIVVLGFIQPPILVSQCLFGPLSLQAQKEADPSEILTASKKYNLNKDKAIVILASPKCKYCITEMKKINKLLQKYELESVTKCIILGDAKDSVDFNSKVNTLDLDSRILDIRDFNLLTKGKLPSLLFFYKKQVSYMRGVEVNEGVMQEFVDIQ